MGNEWSRKLRHDIEFIISSVALGGEKNSIEMQKWCARKGPRVCQVRSPLADQNKSRDAGKKFNKPIQESTQKSSSTCRAQATEKAG